jgi:hypothetical protein
MLFLKRLLTSIGLFVVLFVVFSVGSMAVLGAVAGASAAAKNPDARDLNSGYAAGHAAGEELGKKYGRIVLLTSLGMSAICAITISFTGLLPWCRKPAQPPPLPPA